MSAYERDGQLDIFCGVEPGSLVSLALLERPHRLDAWRAMLGAARARRSYAWSFYLAPDALAEYLACDLALMWHETWASQALEDLEEARLDARRLSYREWAPFHLGDAVGGHEDLRWIQEQWRARFGTVPSRGSRRYKSLPDLIGRALYDLCS